MLITSNPSYFALEQSVSLLSFASEIFRIFTDLVDLKKKQVQSMTVLLKM